MDAQILFYVEALTANTKLTLEALLVPETAAATARAAFDFHFSDPGSLAFQRYYCEVTNNRPAYLMTGNFFRQFKYRYSLQGVDGGYLDRLEGQKRTLLQLIDADKLAELYLGYFARVTLQHGATTQTKDLGSFFAKFTHTFQPAKYCALDNPIRQLLGLDRESFYVGFLVASQAYIGWAGDHPDQMGQIRGALDDHVTGSPFSARMSDLKLLDLLLWYRANRP